MAIVPLDRHVTGVRPGFWLALALLFAAGCAPIAVIEMNPFAALAFVVSATVSAFCIRAIRRPPPALVIHDEAIEVRVAGDAPLRTRLVRADVREIVIDTSGTRAGLEELRFPRSGSAGEHRYLWTSSGHHDLRTAGLAVPNCALLTGESGGVAVALADPAAATELLSSVAPLRVNAIGPTVPRPTPEVGGRKPESVRESRERRVLGYLVMVSPVGMLYVVPGTAGIVAAFAVLTLGISTQVRHRSRLERARADDPA